MNGERNNKEIKETVKRKCLVDLFLVFAYRYVCLSCCFCYLSCLLVIKLIFVITELKTSSIILLKLHFPMLLVCFSCHFLKNRNFTNFQIDLYFCFQAPP